MTYLDTSFLFKLYVVEPGSREAWATLATLRDTLITSWLSDVEMATSFYRTQTPLEAREVHADYLADRASGLFSVVSLDSQTYVRAAEIAKLYSSHFKLRSLDTLHLAIALKNGVSTIATYDDRLAQAARAVGLQVIPA